MPRKSKSKKAEEHTETKTSSKVSPSEKESIHNDDEGNGAEEVWDVIRVVPKEAKCICRNDGCDEQAVATWASNKDPNDKWDLCEKCQLDEFGGWPEGVGPSEDDEESASSSGNEIPQISQTQDEVSKSPSMQTDDASSAESNGQQEGSNRECKSAQTEDASTENGEEEEQEEEWDLKKILSFEDIKKEATIKCSTEDCVLPACCIWVSNLAPTTKWYSCLDCQEQDFGGWPSTEDLPLASMESKHLKLIGTKCSKQKSPALPSLPSLQNASPSTQKNDRTNFVTPPPNSLAPKATQEGKEKSEKSGVSKITPGTTKPNKPSSSALAIHKKWQDAAEAMGGKDARIVVKKPAAKKLIFDLLYDAFRPMNINEIFKALKATVPSPVLNACLKEMALDSNEDKNPFADSDQEEDPGEKSPSNEPYTGSLFFKPGKNQSTNLYYVDHTKLEGLDPDERNALAQDMVKDTLEHNGLKDSLKTTLEKATQLLSEPTNEQIAALLESEEDDVATLKVQVEEALKLKVNEKHKQKTKSNIQKMAVQWRKRKRMCMEFLIKMEEITDGTVRAKKCLSGDGQIALDSDDIVAKAAVEFAKQKRARAGTGGKKPRKLLKSSITQSASSKATLADENFVAVNFDSQCNVVRVYVEP